MVNLVDYLIDEEVMVESDGGWQLKGELGGLESDIPENIRQLIEKQIERLSPDERTGARRRERRRHGVLFGGHRGWTRPSNRMGRGALRSARASAISSCRRRGS